MTRVVKTLLAHAEALLSELLALESPDSPESTESLIASELPDDALVARYFKRRRELGRSDRAFIAEAVYSVLRRRRSLSARCAHGDAGGVSPRRLLLAALLCARDDGERTPPAEYSRAEIEDSLDETERGAIGRACAANLDALPSAVRLDLPDWIYDRLVTRLGEENAARLAESFKHPAPLDL
ncbi:MAG: hypothetical protein LBM17_06375, partial [Candidatus Accumulibacter sp.]|nr:hypothetical protein [Accumulibacter sp.]